GIGSGCRPASLDRDFGRAPRRPPSPFSPRRSPARGPVGLRAATARTGDGHPRRKARNPPMRRDGVIPDPEPGANQAGFDPERVGRAGSRPLGVGRVVALLAVAISLRWLPAFENSPEGLPMYRSRGHSGTLIQGFAFSPDGETLATVDGLDQVTLT